MLLLSMLLLSILSLDRLSESHLHSVLIEDACSSKIIDGSTLSQTIGQLAEQTIGQFELLRSRVVQYAARLMKLTRLCESLLI